MGSITVKPWPKLLREVAKANPPLRVRAKREFQNGFVIVPKGAIGIVRAGRAGWHLLDFVGDRCACCGVQPRVSKLNPNDLELIEEGE